MKIKCKIPFPITLYCILCEIITNLWVIKSIQYDSSLGLLCIFITAPFSFIKVSVLELFVDDKTLHNMSLDTSVNFIIIDSAIVIIVAILLDLIVAKLRHKYKTFSKKNEKRY